MTRKLHIAVCGCGPAGLAAALLLNRQGHRVELFERFSTPRPVGSGLILQPTGLSVLAELGVLDQIMQLGAPVDRLFGRVVPSGRVVLNVRYHCLGSGWSALAVHRAALFSALHAAVLADGLVVTGNVTLERVGHRNDGATLLDTQRREIGNFDLIVDALGARSPLIDAQLRRRELAYGALWVNVPWSQRGPFSPNALEQRYRRASSMAGVLPIGRRAIDSAPEAAFFWSLKHAALERWLATPIWAWKAEVDSLWPEAASLLGGIHSHDQVTFAKYDHFTARTPWSDRVVHIGDAAHATSPQLGQGANMALLDALALARSLQTQRELPVMLGDYARMRRWHVRLFQWASALFTPFYQSDSLLRPWVRDWLTAPLSTLPVAEQILVRLVSGMTIPAIRRAKFSPLRMSRPGEAINSDRS